MNSQPLHLTIGLLGLGLGLIIGYDAVIALLALDAETLVIAGGLSTAWLILARIHLHKAST